MQARDEELGRRGGSNRRARRSAATLALLAVLLGASSLHGGRAADPQPYRVTIAATGNDAIDQALHDASTIAAVIVEPIACSGGVLLPPKGYLKRLREICDRHGILLIFDEVITGFGRTGSPFAAEEFGVTPDLITLAKGLTNGCVPMGAVLVSGSVYDAFMHGPEHVIELFHGYTYSAHPLACAAGLAALDLYRDEPDAGVHGAAAWTLRRWNQHDKMSEIDRDMSRLKPGSQRRWFVNGQRQTMVVDQHLHQILRLRMVLER